jgi:TolB-like protein
MHLASAHGHRRTVAVALGLLVLIAAGVAVGWNRSRTRLTVHAGFGAPPVITIAWRTVGHEVEPWSGVGLGEQVRQALNARGVVVSQSGAPLGTPRPGSAKALATRARRLNPTYLLAGTVSRKGERSEIGMQLVRVQDSATVWTSTFWRDATDLESLVSDLAVTVAQVLETETSHERRLAP